MVGAKRRQEMDRPDRYGRNDKESFYYLYRVNRDLRQFMVCL